MNGKLLHAFKWICASNRVDRVYCTERKKTNNYSLSKQMWLHTFEMNEFATQSLRQLGGFLSFKSGKSAVSFAFFFTAVFIYLVFFLLQFKAKHSRFQWRNSRESCYANNIDNIIKNQSILASSNVLWFMEKLRNENINLNVAICCVCAFVCVLLRGNVLVGMTTWDTHWLVGNFAFASGKFQQQFDDHNLLYTSFAFNNAIKF